MAIPPSSAAPLPESGDRDDVGPNQGVEPVNDSDLASLERPTPFTIVILPDTQFYTGGGYPEILQRQTRWIVDQKEERDIVFVLHEGDITNTNQAYEWQLADDSLSVLDGEVPYALAVGNHDMGISGDARDMTKFNTSFPVSRYRSLPTFGGVFETGKLDNSFHLFNAGGVNWLILSLEFGPREQVLDWADEVLTTFADRRAIVLTHTYLYSDNTLHGSSPSHRWNPHSYAVASLPGGVNDGVEMWEKLIKRHENLSFVFNGHVLSDGVGRRIGVGDHGNLVYEMLANYQQQPRGGNGWLRIVEFDPLHGRVTVKTYSPYLDQYLTDGENQFQFENVAFFRPTFLDVPFDHPYHDQIEALYWSGFTIGCQTDPPRFCPDRALTRAESAVFTERGVWGPQVNPPDPGTSAFADMQTGDWGLKWATALWNDGYTAGCALEPLRFCPGLGHTRGEGAVFYIRMLYGTDFKPPQPKGIFTDVPIGWWGAKWVEAAHSAGLIPACSEEPLRFCPNDPLTRGLAAYMMANARGLTIQDP